MIKIEKVLGYFLKAKEKVLILRPSQSFKVVAYIAASFAIHHDGKLHLGIVFHRRSSSFLCITKAEMCKQKPDRG